MLRLKAHRGHFSTGGRFPCNTFNHAWCERSSMCCHARPRGIPRAGKHLHTHKQIQRANDTLRGSKRYLEPKWLLERSLRRVNRQTGRTRRFLSIVSMEALTSGHNSEEVTRIVHSERKLRRFCRKVRRSCQGATGSDRSAAKPRQVGRRGGPNRAEVDCPPDRGSHSLCNNGTSFSRLKVNELQIQNRELQGFLQASGRFHVDLRGSTRTPA